MLAAFKDYEYQDVLRAAVTIEHQCSATHKGTVFVQEKIFEGETVWQGDVEIFHLNGNNESKICYAWQHQDEKGQFKMFTILANKWIDSPSRAVQAALFTGVQPPFNPIAKNYYALKQLIEECRSMIRKMAMSVENMNAAIETAGEEIKGKYHQNRKASVG